MFSFHNFKAHILTVPVFLFAFALLWPLAWVAWNGWTLTGLYEESLGYRYFFSLRQVQEPDKFVFLPQGHLPSILHRLLQRVLSLFYEVDTLRPRIDVFAYLAVFLAHTTSIVAFAWVIKPLRSHLAQVLSVVFWALPYYLTGFYGAYQVLSPDYLAWILLVALISAGLITRWSETRAWQLNESVILGVYIGIALGVKLTLVIFPATVGLLLILRSDGRLFNKLLMGALSVGIGLIVWFLVLLLYNFGDFHLVQEFFGYLTLFLSSSIALYELTYLEFFQQVIKNTSWEVVLLALSPILILFMSVGVRSRVQTRVLVSLLVGSLVYLEVIFLRFTQGTFFEAGIYSIMAFWVLGYVLFWGRVVSNFWILFVGFIFMVIATLPIIRELPQSMPMLIAEIKENDGAQRELQNIFLIGQKPVAFLIPNNHFRLLSIDSAILKGGGAIYGGKFPDSPFVQRLFSDRMYFSGNSTKSQVKPLSLLDYGTIVFTMLKNPRKDNHISFYLSKIPKRVQELERFYNTNLQNYNCDDWVDFGKEAEPRLAVVCHQRTIRIQNTPGSEGLFAINNSGYWYSPVEEEEKMKSKNGFITDDAGNTFRLVAEENDVLRFTNVGPWDSVSSKLMGLLGVYRNGQWAVDLEGWSPVNGNTHFMEGSREDSLLGYWISPGEIEATVNKLKDQTGSFVRITATTASDYMVLTGNVPLITLNGEPISIRAQIRIPRARNGSLTITDTINDNGKSVSHQVRILSPPNEWISVIVRASTVSYPDSRDNYAVGLNQVKTGDYFDIRELSAFVGVLP